MDLTTIIGILLGMVAVALGMIFKHISFAVLINWPAICIIGLGTIAAIMVATPMNEFKNIPRVFGVIFKNRNSTDPNDIIALFSKLATTARRDGLLALESQLTDIDDPFLRSGLTLAIDGQTPEFIRDVLSEELDAMEERHRANAHIFTQAGSYAPTLGVLGAVLGLIAALGNMDDTDALGAAISAAFVATMFGIFTGYVIWHPFANKLKRKSQQELLVKRITVEGILSVIEGQPAAIIQQKLLAYVPLNQRKAITVEGGGQDE
ncbi:MAG: flagellar motor stator protein MotA [Bacilli bacterium]